MFLIIFKIKHFLLHCHMTINFSLMEISHNRACVHHLVWLYKFTKKDQFFTGIFWNFILSTSKTICFFELFDILWIIVFPLTFKFRENIASKRNFKETINSRIYKPVHILWEEKYFSTNFEKDTCCISVSTSCS